jgi:galactose-1-phosphate uridylyltransferase
LHKQLVAIDEHGANVDQVLLRVRDNPNHFNECGVNYAMYHNLLVAENSSAIAFAGFGHRYPTIEVISKSSTVHPWEQSDEEVREMSDLIHAIHVATGAEVPTNEEWHHTPIDVDVPLPWRINIKWRISTLAGFEGGTKIYINTISPGQLRSIVVGRLMGLSEAGLTGDLRIGEECSGVPNPLRYSPTLR